MNWENMELALCKKKKSIPKGEKWIYERKFDGVRGINMEGRKLMNRDSGTPYINRDIWDSFPEIELPETQMVNDGEITCPGGLNQLMKRIMTESQFDVDLMAENNPATYRVFDIMQLEGEDLRREKNQMERKEILEDREELKSCDNVEIVDYVKDPDRLWERASEENWEGIVAKKTYKKYPIRREAGNWVKVKNWDNEVFDIIDARETSEGGFVIVIEPNGKGQKQKIVVNDREEQKKIEKAVEEGGGKAEVRFLERSKNGRLRHISYEGLV